jgi:predicted methyltransferase
MRGLLDFHLRVATLVLLTVVLVLPLRATGAETGDALKTAIDSPSRSAKNVARDPYRHPEAALRFFGLKDDEQVVEILPGGGYWTEILAPYLKDHGTYYAALPPADDTRGGRSAFLARLAADPGRYGKVVATTFGPDGKIAPDGSADLVLTFRNLHDWMADGTAETDLAAFYRALKPGGILGIEDHRAPADQPQDPKAKSGYVREDYAIALIEKAGFKLLARSDIGDNPKDTKNYPAGVWTLPPTLKLGATDRAKYLAIGESDRFTLKFEKPAG